MPATFLELRTRPDLGNGNVHVCLAHERSGVKGILSSLVRYLTLRRIKFAVLNRTRELSLCEDRRRIREANVHRDFR